MTKEYIMRTFKNVCAQEVLLSQTNFTLSEKDWTEFQSELEAPTLPTAELVALMTFGALKTNRRTK